MIANSIHFQTPYKSTILFIVLFLILSCGVNKKSTLSRGGGYIN